MNSYEMVKGFSPMIREAIRTDRMPPYNADPHVGTFANDMNLPAEGPETLVHWIEAGAPRGAGADPLKVNAKPAPEWPLGKPDLILDLPAFTVPATGVVDYQNPTVKNPLTEGRWLRASTVKPATARPCTTCSPTVRAATPSAPSPPSIRKARAPGSSRAGTFRFQMHYTPYGKETVETTRVGLYFYPKDKPPDDDAPLGRGRQRRHRDPAEHAAPQGDRLRQLPRGRDALLASSRTRTIAARTWRSAAASPADQGRADPHPAEVRLQLAARLRLRRRRSRSRRAPS